MGVPWPPANWRTYATYPEVMQLFWQRLKPAVATQSYLCDSLAIAQQAFLDLHRWCQLGYQIDITKVERQHIQRELNAFTFDNPQLLLQQVALKGSYSK